MRRYSMSASGGLGVWSPPAPRPQPNQDSGKIPVITSFVTPCVSRMSRQPPPSRAIIPVLGSPLLTRSPNGPVRSTRTSVRIPTLPPIEEDILLASVDGSPNPPAPADSRAWGWWWSCNVYRLVGHPSWINDRASAAPGSYCRELSRTLIALRCLPSCKLRGETPCPQPFRGNLSSTRRVRWQ